MFSGTDLRHSPTVTPTWRWESGRCGCCSGDWRQRRRGWGWSRRGWRRLCGPYRPTACSLIRLPALVSGEEVADCEVDRLGKPGPAQQDFIETAPLLAVISKAAVGGASATGSRRGQRVVRVRGAAAVVDALVLGRLCAEVEGFNLQAAARVAANDREGLERMGRYLDRPPIAGNRLTRLDDGRLELQLKRPWRDGTTSFVFTPHELIERLVALVPRPRAHLTRYFGVFAPAFAARAGIVPAVAPSDPVRPAGCDGGLDGRPPRGRRFPWASIIGGSF